jgi:hypothetical protein
MKVVADTNMLVSGHHRDSLHSLLLDTDLAGLFDP